MPPKDPTIARELQKIAIFKSKKKYEEARCAAVCLRSKYRSMSEIATKSGESRQAVYRLLSLSTQRRVKKEYMRKLKPEVCDEVL